MNDLRDYRERAVRYIYDNFETLFPDMEVRIKRGFKQSPIHLPNIPGERRRAGDGVGCTIYQTYINDFSVGGIPLLDFYLREKGLSFSFENMMAIYKDFGIIPPGSSTTKKLEEWEKKQDLREWAQKTMIGALYEDTPEAKEILNYLRDVRGWTDEDIKKIGLGYFSKSLRKGLTSEKLKPIADELSCIGEDYVLSIPHRSGNSLEGWNFRNLKGIEPKYKHTSGDGSKSTLQGLRRTGKDRLIIVEGDLDALHPQARGVLNVAATMGGQIRLSQVEDAIKKGYKNFILLFDNDERGQGFIDPSIKNIKAGGGSAYISSLPEGVKDTDEFLKTRTAQEWLKVVQDRSLPACLRDLWNEMSKFPKEGVNNYLEQAKIRDTFREIIKRTPVEEWEILRTNIKYYADSLLIMGAEGLEGMFLQAKSTLNEKSRKELLQKIGEDYKAALESENFFVAEDIIRKRSEELSSLRDSSRYAKDFAPFDSVSGITKELSSIEEGIPTGIEFSGGNQTKNHLTIKEGLSFVCGSQGHRKTTFLLNIALNEAERNLKEYSYRGGDEPLKKVLFLTYEMDRRRIIESLINIHLNGIFDSYDNIHKIEDYFKKGEDLNYLKDGKRYKLSQEINSFLERYILSGAITISYVDYKVGSLIGALKYFRAKNSVSLTLIDYAQQIYSENPSRQRTEEVKEIVNRIKDYAINTSLPVLMGAQFNRDVNSPLDVNTNKIGEAGDFERIAVDIIGLYYLRKWDGSDADKVEKLYRWNSAPEDIKDKLDKFKNPNYAGLLYVKLIKSRFGDYPLDLILPINDKSGRIDVNRKDLLKVKEPQQGRLFSPPPATITGGAPSDILETFEDAPF